MSKSVYRERTLVIIALVLLPLKLGYLLSRPIFFSGPDASTFISASQDFAKKDFFSPDISGIPYWPSGYPWLNSIAIRAVESQWIHLTQIIQVLLFSITCLLFYRLLSPYCGTKLSFIGSLGLLLQPSWIVANGEAMYETYLISFLVIGLYLLFGSKTSLPVKHKTLGLLLLGYSVVIHPRILPIAIFLLVLLQIFFKFRIKEFFACLLIFSILPLVFALRNFIAVKEFVLSNALVGTASSYNLLFKGCSNVECLSIAILDNFPIFMSQGFTNVGAFFSPHWGPLAKGTWFHNLSPLAVTSDGFSLNLIVNLGTVISLISMLFLLLGMGRALIRHNFYDLFFAFSSIIFIITAFIVFGDNRHRLVASFFFLPLQLCAAQFVWTKYILILSRTKEKVNSYLVASRF
jgi:hypothetical protein